MKQTARLWALIRMLLAASVLVALVGCGAKPFRVLDRKLCKGTDAAGGPVDEADAFATDDPAVYFWFKYAGAKPGQAVQVRFTYTDPQGAKSSELVRAELKTGVDKTAVATLRPSEGETLAPGRYEAEILNDQEVPYGPPLPFTIE